MPRLIDLSMPVHPRMQRYPGTIEPSIQLIETTFESAKRIGTDKMGFPELFAHSVLTFSEHCGTHIDARSHGGFNDSWSEHIPLGKCYGPGLRLDLRHKRPGQPITAADLEAALQKESYALKGGEIVLLWTGAADYNGEPRYLTDHPGMVGESAEWLIDRGVQVMGIDAPGFDLPIQTMLERKDPWPCHRLFKTREYWHIENLANLGAIPRAHGFRVSALPLKWTHATGTHIRAVAILED
ncbi:MAG: cyclase family protein [Nitrospinota bacterium]